MHSIFCSSSYNFILTFNTNLGIRCIVFRRSITRRSHAAEAVRLFLTCFDSDWCQAAEDINYRVPYAACCLYRMSLLFRFSWISTLVLNVPVLILSEVAMGKEMTFPLWCWCLPLLAAMRQIGARETTRVKFKEASHWFSWNYITTEYRHIRWCRSLGVPWSFWEMC